MICVEISQYLCTNNSRWCMCVCIFYRSLVVRAEIEDGV